MRLTWDRHGPRKDERLLAGRVAGALWLSVVPMLVLGLLMPGTDTEHWLALVLITLPTTAWGVACLFFMPWERVRTPLFFHVPSVLALPYVGLLVGATGVTRSPFLLTPLLLLVFCAYFYPARTALVYLVGCIAVQALPLTYSSDLVSSGLIGQVWVATVAYAAVGGVVILGKRQLLALRDAATELSLRDALTGLANRRALSELLDRHDSGARHKDAIGFLLIDLDDFKEANSRYGMLGGDRLLCAVGDALCRLARGDDLVVRLGGDEFAIVTYGLPPQALSRLADRTLEAIRDSVVNLEFAEAQVSASAGWAVCPHDTDSAGELLGVADLALRTAKLNGKQRAHGPLDMDATSILAQP
jgi:diguanylate cyclase (GGDEF)-like protein